jgi:hypothetical protein
MHRFSLNHQRQNGKFHPAARREFLSTQKMEKKIEAMLLRWEAKQPG